MITFFSKVNLIFSWSFQEAIFSGWTVATTARMTCFPSENPRLRKERRYCAMAHPILDLMIIKDRK